MALEVNRSIDIEVLLYTKTLVASIDYCLNADVKLLVDYSTTLSGCALYIMESCSRRSRSGNPDLLRGAKYSRILDSLPSTLLFHLRAPPIIISTLWQLRMACFCRL